ncbi:MAG: Gfo/Idh/MocA family oxidoreductase [Candidatus Buchananbacteria bacterium]
MNILIVGLGSIGKKHLASLNQLKRQFCLNIFVFQPASYGAQYFFDLKKNIIKNQIKAVIICNPTNLHLKTTKISLELGANVFVEKPLSAIYTLKEFKKLDQISQKRKLTIMVGYDMRFNPWIMEIERLIKNKIIGDVWGGRILAGQYLPDWRKNVDYRQVYSAKKKMGGGVLLDLSHELDYLNWLVSKPIKKILARKFFTQRLKIETEDICSLIVEYKDKTVIEIHLDYLIKPYRRTIELYGSRGTLVWDDNEQVIKVYQSQIHSPKLVRVKLMTGQQILLTEMKHFFDCIVKYKTPINSLNNSILVSKIIDRADQSFKTNKTVNL